MNLSSPKYTYYRERAVVYSQLMRVEKPIGTLLLLWPTLWALWISAKGVPSWDILTLFILGTFLTRSAGCVMNDYADRNFDLKVERTKNRPFARGAVSKHEALILCIVLCFLAMLCLIPMNYLTWLMSIPAIIIALTYPFTKRFFPIPQLYLGIAFSFGIPMAFSAQTNSIPSIVWLLFTANICWTVAFDTIYAMADKPDDLLIGIKTSAITFGDYDIFFTMIFHGIFSLIMLAIGWVIQAGYPYWIAILIVIFLQYKQYTKIKTRDRKACFETFLSNNNIGLIIWLGITLQYFIANH